jgi:uncharacterized C2H2 Zn-finger protein
MSDLVVNRRCFKDGCDAVIQVTTGFFVSRVSDNDYIHCANGHYQPLFAFGSPEAQIAWLERSLLKAAEHAEMRRYHTENAMRCPFHRHGIVARDGRHLIRHVLRKHPYEAEALAEDK